VPGVHAVAEVRQNGRLSPQRRKEPGWGGHPQPGTLGWVVVRREVVQEALAAAVGGCPVEQRGGEVLAEPHRAPQHPGRRLSGELGVELGVEPCLERDHRRPAHLGGGGPQPRATAARAAFAAAPQW
jgi:hypothetical protein